MLYQNADTLKESRNCYQLGFEPNPVALNFSDRPARKWISARSIGGGNQSGHLLNMVKVGAERQSFLQELANDAPPKC